MTCETINCDVINGRPCRGCAGMPFQCNHCRTNHPNGQTITRTAIVATMVTTGCDARTAEAVHGANAGQAI